MDLPAPPRRHKLPLSLSIPLGLILLAALIGLGVNVHYRAVHSSGSRTDFMCYYLVAQAALQGGDIYAVADPHGWKVHYPPGMAAMFAPMAWLSYEQAVVLWYVITAGALMWSCGRVVRICDELAARPVGVIVVAAMIVNLAPTMSGLQRGQFSALMTALMIEAFWAYRRDQSALAGFWIGLAAALKGYPAVAMWPLIVRRDWRAIGMFTATVAVLTVALPMIVMGPATGWDTVQRFVFEKLLPLLSDPAVAERESFAGLDHFGSSNQSLFAVLGRLLCRSAAMAHGQDACAIADLPSSVARGISLAVTLVLVGVMGWLSWRPSPRGALREAVLWCLPMLGANFISTIAWHHYYTVLNMPYALAGVMVVMPECRRMRGWIAMWLAVAIALNWGYFAGVEQAMDRLPRKAGLLLIGSLMLWAMLAWVCFALGKQDAGTTAEKLLVPADLRAV